ncbi:MAG: PE-PPE domain-containing protein [Planctomycetota bacterium]
MHRRDFLRNSTATGAGLLAPQAFGQQPSTGQPASNKPTIEIPGYGSISLDPADYDAAKIAAMFERDFPQAVGMIRSRHADAIKALSSGDATQMAKLAGPLIQQASKAAALPFIGKGLKDALMSPPTPVAIQEGAGTPVYYVNGIFTNKKIATDEAKALAGRLPGRPVWLIYNEGTAPSENQQLAGRDIEEAYRDRVWPVYLTGLLTGRSFGAGLTTALGGDSPLQHNPATRGLAWLMHRQATQSPGEPFAVVGYSQGAMIVRNALFTLAILGHQQYVEQQMAAVLPGLPINRQEVWPVPKKLTVLVDPADPIPAYLGLEGDGFQARGANVEHHKWFDQGYVSKITPEMLS